MKQLSIIIALYIISILPCMADDYIITSMNGKKIIIGNNRECAVGSQFTSNEVIHWQAGGVSIIEAQNIKTKEFCYFAPKGKQNKNNTQSSNLLQRLLNHFINITHLSTRESSLYDLEEVLTGKEFHLADTLIIKIDEVQENRKYFASFYFNGEKYNIPLEVNNEGIVFERNMFNVVENKLPYKCVLTIYYKEDDCYHQITDGMILTIYEIDK